MTTIELLDLHPTPVESVKEPENWYVEPFTKRTGCKTAGQCSDDCNCGCPYNTMTEVEQLPLIEKIALLFPNEWLAFIISPAEDDDYEPTHGKLVAHSPNPDEVYDAVNRVLWNQHVYIYFNGDFAPLQASYGPAWEQEVLEVAKQTHLGMQASPMSPSTPPPELVELTYSALAQLYDGPKINEAIRCLRLARIKAVQQSQNSLMVALDTALDKLETPLPLIDAVIWQLEEALADLES